MEREFTVTCPDCKTILIVDRASGKVLESRKPLVEESSGDRFGDAFTKMAQDKERREGALDNIAEKLESKKKNAEELFRASMEEAKNSKEEKPDNIFDLD